MPPNPPVASCRPDPSDRVVGRADDYASASDHPVNGDLLDRLIRVFLELQRRAQRVDEIILNLAIGAFMDVVNRIIP